MKHLGLLLTVVLISFVVLGIAVFAFITEADPPGGVIVVPVDPTITHMEATLAEQEARYEAEINDLEQRWQQQQTAFQNRLEGLNQDVQAARQQLAELRNQETVLSNQWQRLQVKRAKQLATYETNLEQRRADYIARQEQLASQLEAAQTELDQLEAELGR